MAAIQACKEAIWIQKLLEELKHKQKSFYILWQSECLAHCKESSISFQNKVHRSSVPLPLRNSGRQKCEFIENPYERESNKCYDQVN